MRIGKKDKALFFISMALMALFASTILVMPLAERLSSGGNMIPLVLLGGFFWGFLLLAYLVLIILKIRIRSQTGKIKHSDQPKKRFKVYHTTAGLISLIFSAASFIGFIASLILTNYRGYLCFVFLSLFIFSFQMYFLLNGKIFTQIIAKNNE